MRDGRAATVRGRFKRVDIDDVEIIAADAEPEAALIEETERAALREFVATLTERERRVMACKYGGERESGRVLIPASSAWGSARCDPRRRRSSRSSSGSWRS